MQLLEREVASICPLVTPVPALTVLGQAEAGSSVQVSSLTWQEPQCLNYLSPAARRHSSRMLEFQQVLDVGFPMNVVTATTYVHLQLTVLQILVVEVIQAAPLCSFPSLSPLCLLIQGLLQELFNSWFLEQVCVFHICLASFS